MFTVTEKDRIELEALRKLEVAVRQMFEWTDWDQCDDEPALAVRKVERRLNEVTAAKNLLLCDDR